MATLSYNEERRRELKLRHVFWPGIYEFMSETVIAVLALILFNISWLSAQLLSQNLNNVDPLALWSHIARQSLNAIGKHGDMQQIVLFGLWAMVGVLIYILAFRGIQLFAGAEHSVSRGVGYVRREHSKGLVRWLESLHDFFMLTIISIAGVSALLVGAVVCFGTASQELNNGLSEPFPHSVWPLGLSVLAAIVSVRVIILGISLLSPRFRNWYTA